jgi:hypothetical protein
LRNGRWGSRLNERRNKGGDMENMGKLQQPT